MSEIENFINSDSVNNRDKKSPRKTFYYINIANTECQKENNGI